jgi:hypothetical protein
LTRRPHWQGHPFKKHFTIYDENGVSIPFAETLSMPKDPIGETAIVEQNDDNQILAIFPNSDNFKYVVDIEEYNTLQKLLTDPQGT